MTYKIIGSALIKARVPVLAVGLFCGLLLVACDKKPEIKPPVEDAIANVKENAIAGRYKWIENGRELGVVILEEDHSVTNWRGEKKSGYKWDLQTEGLLLVWLKGFNFFPHAVKPGVYEGQHNRDTIRIEKE